MIADALQSDMRAHAACTRHDNALLVAVANGNVSPSQVSQYLVNVRELLQNTPRFLERARIRALENGDARLADHFAHKAEEELGHAAWADQDLATLSRHTDPMAQDPNASGPIVPALREWIAWTLDLAEEDPALVLAYMFFNEGLIVMLGEETLSNLELRCGIPRSSVTVVDHHIRLDRDHVDEALATIDDLVGDPWKLPRMREVVREGFAIFERFGAQIMEASNGQSELPAVHAPAA